jgi:hypothetical protein
MYERLSQSPRVAPRPRSGGRAGLTFLEVMFAVAILGVGFIMVSAMFPVAIKQTQATAEETVAASVGPSGIRMIQGVATDANMPPTGPAGSPGAFVDLRTGAPAVWNAVRTSMVNSFDARYAWVPLYRRDYGDNFATVAVIVVQSRLQNQYVVGRDVYRQPSDAASTPAVLEPKSVSLSFTANVTAPDRVSVSGGGADAVATGAYLVVAQDGAGTGRGNGRIVRVGNQVGGAGNTWELMPGDDLKGGTYAPSSGTGYVVGRAWSDPASPGVFEGPAQDIGAYVSYIRLN